MNYTTSATRGVGRYGKKPSSIHLSALRSWDSRQLSVMPTNCGDGSSTYMVLQGWSSIKNVQYRLNTIIFSITSCILSRTQMGTGSSDSPTSAARPNSPALVAPAELRNNPLHGRSYKSKS